MQSVSATQHQCLNQIISFGDRCRYVNDLVGQQVQSCGTIAVKANDRFS